MDKYEAESEGGRMTVCADSFEEAAKEAARALSGDGFCNSHRYLVTIRDSSGTYRKFKVWEEVSVSYCAVETV